MISTGTEHGAPLGSFKPSSALRPTHCSPARRPKMAINLHTWDVYTIQSEVYWDYHMATLHTLIYVYLYIYIYDTYQYHIPFQWPGQIMARMPPKNWDQWSVCFPVVSGCLCSLFIPNLCVSGCSMSICWVTARNPHAINLCMYVRRYVRTHVHVNQTLPQWSAATW